MKLKAPYQQPICSLARNSRTTIERSTSWANEKTWTNLAKALFQVSIEEIEKAFD